MSDYEYSIGTTVENLQNLEDDLGIPPPHPAPYTEWSAEYTGGDGRVHGDGWPSATWQWDYLSAAHIAALRTYCPGKSANITIRTLEPDLTSYGVYSCVVVWPSGGEYEMGRVSTDFELLFTHLEEAS